MEDSYFKAASLFGQFESHIVTIAIGVFITFGWSILWPRWIRDDEGQKLPPSSLARAMFSLSLVVLYLALVCAAFLLPGVFKNLAPLTFSMITEFLAGEKFQSHAPFGVIILMGVLYGIPQIKELFERWAYFLHASQYRRADEQVLQRHFEQCDFVASDVEINRNLSFIEQFDVYVTDNNTPIIQSQTVGLWRKTSALLRLISEDATRENPVLSDKDKADIERLEEAHVRKTRLSMNIIRILDQFGTNQLAEPKVARIASTLSDASHRDRDEVHQAENMARQIAGADLDDAQIGEIQRPMRLSSQQLADYLNQIGGYFYKEYQVILGDVSRLAAKAIVRAGDEAPVRLDAAREAGFTGLGRIEKHSFDGVLSTLLIAWTVVFGSFMITFFAMERQPNTTLVFSIALTVAIATTIGSIWGSRRRLIERRSVPWSSYLTAGALAVVAFCFVHGVRFAWDPVAATEILKKTYPDAASFSVTRFLREIWPFSLSLVFLVVGMCALARAPRWPWARSSMVLERISDGVFVGVIYALGFLAALITHASIETAFGLRMKERMAEGSMMPLVMMAMGFVVGFVIGCAILREVRRIAHSYVIATGGAGPQSSTPYLAEPPKPRAEIGQDLAMGHHPTTAAGT